MIYVYYILDGITIYFRKPAIKIFIPITLNAEAGTKLGVTAATEAEVDLKGLSDGDDEMVKS